jgi:cobaltochelatase CobN
MAFNRTLRGFTGVVINFWLTFGLLPALSFGQELAKDSSERGDVGFIGLHGGIFEQLREFAPELNLRLRYFQDSEIERGEADLGSVDVLFVQHTRAQNRESYRALFQAARSKNPRLVVIAFQSSTHELFRNLGIADLLTRDEQAGAYYGSTRENLRRLLLYTGSTYLGRQWPVEPPESLVRQGFYHPGHDGPFRSAEEFLVWLRATRQIRPDQARLLIAVHGTHLAFQQPAVVDALILEAERQGAVAGAIIDGRSKDYEAEVRAFQPSAVIHTCHSFDSLPFRVQLDVPHLHSIFIRKQSIDQFQQSLEGLSGSELAFHVISQELIGAVEPQVGGGTRSGQGGFEAIEPITDRVTHLVARALSLARLRLKSPEEKRIAIIYYDREMGKGELMRGSSTGMHMNAPRSLLNVLEAMHQHGYQISPLPRFEGELLGWMMERGRQVGVWAPAELDRLVRTGSPVLIPSDQYAKWYQQKIPADRRRQLEERWGPPPGRFMVWSKGDQQFIVVPRVDLGNVLLLPQPLRGELNGNDSASDQTHDKVTTPPHNYLATYFWLEQEYQADAVVHFGTHGSEFALPGKPSGLAQRDWPDILMGRLPNFNPWIIENMVESSPVKRRVYGTLISHLPPPIVDGGLSDELESLHEYLDKWETLEEGALKAGFRKELTRMIHQMRLDVDLQLSLPDEGIFADDQLAKVAKYLHDIKEETTPVNLHVFGQPPREDLLVPYLVQILRRPFLHALEHLMEDPGLPGHLHPQPHLHPHAHQDSNHSLRPAAERIVDLVVRRSIEPKVAVGTVLGREIDNLPEKIEKGLQLAADLNEGFQKTGQEIDNLLRGLDGKFVPPGPGNSPVRNPSAVPTGRNMYLLNPEEVPTRPSWKLGVKLAKQIIENHQQQHGEMPSKIGFDLRSSATFRDYGVMEAQILYLMGVEPIWDEKQLVNDLRLIPREQLGRPRVDVFIAAGGWYESNLPSRLQLWDKAVRLVVAAEEADNLIRKNTESVARQLREQGLSEDRAALLARGRIFGIAPGRENGGMLSYRVARSGDWETREQIADAYLSSHKYVYTEGAWGEAAEAAYDQTIQGTHTVVRSWSDHLTGPLSSRYNWLHGGSLCLAVERMTGKRPEYVFSDVRDPDRAGVINSEQALRREYRVRLFNRKWLEGMMKEGYAGADHMRFLVSNSFGWEVMRPGSVGNDNWKEMKNVLVDDKLQLGLHDWFDKNNPFAIQDAIACMLEAARKGYWQADDADLLDLAQQFAQNVSKHGMSGHLTSGGNGRLHQMVLGLIREGGDPSQELLVQYEQRFDEQTATLNPAPSASQASVVSSNQTEAQPMPDAAPSPPTNNTVEQAGSAQAQPVSEVATVPAPTAIQGTQLSEVPAENTRRQSRIWLILLGVFAIILSGFVLRRKL